MVKSQLRHFVQCKPPRVSSIIATLHLLQSHQGIVGDGDDALARVTLRRSEGVELTDVGSLQACLFLQLTQRAFFGTLVHLHKTTRECPSSFVGFNTSLHQKHSQLCTVKPEDYTVGRHTRMGVLVAVFQLFVCLVCLIHILIALKLRHKGSAFVLNIKTFLRKSYAIILESIIAEGFTLSPHKKRMKREAQRKCLRLASRFLFISGAAVWISVRPPVI